MDKESPMGLGSAMSSYRGPSSIPFIAVPEPICES